MGEQPILPAGNVLASRVVKTDLWHIHRRLSQEVKAQRFGPPVTHVYNPLEYAEVPLRAYLDRYGRGTREILLLGMNPGPFGMAQTGVPFGDPIMVRDWLGIEGPVRSPEHQHPKRPVLGFGCPRREISGKRLWGWARDTFESPERFFSRFMVLNYCPLVFMEESGRNRTPDKLPAQERARLFAACDEALRKEVALLRPRMVIGIGAFAEARVRAALEDVFSGVLGRIPHPSPASPVANGGWSVAAHRAFEELGVNMTVD